MPEEAGFSDEESLIGLPEFETGGRVERTGIALIHEGEYILPAPGSEALVSPAEVEAVQVINYHFPVEIEVVGELEEAQLQRVATFVFETLNSALRSRM